MAETALRNNLNIIFKVPEQQVSVFRIYVIQDPETGYWTALSNEIPGFVAEAETYEKLENEAKECARECIELNGVPHFENIELIPKELTAQEARDGGLL